MRTLIYDGSFAGWLSTVFDIYEYKFAETTILPQSRPQHGLFSDTHIVNTDETKALRVWKGLQQRISRTAATSLYRSFLSEERNMEDKLLQYARYAFSKKLTIEHDYSHPAVLYVVSTAKKVHREKHRMEAFVRFQQTRDHLYYAVIDPDFNVLPLIQPHFEKRYADQRWMIYDSRRRTGLYYDLHSTQNVQIDFSEAISDPGDVTAVLDEKEELYRQLWQQYFDSINISARQNMKLHIRHMPLRYWKYLPEKQPFPNR